MQRNADRGRTAPMSGVADERIVPRGATPDWMRRLIINRRRELGSAAALIIIFATFAAFNIKFLSVDSLSGILTVAGELGTIALGEGLLMVSGEFDISVAAVFTLSSIIMATLLKASLPEPVALITALFFGLVAGWINGEITLRTHIPSFIATLGTQMFWYGMALLITGGWPLSLLNPPGILNGLGGATVGTSALHISAVWWLVSAVVIWILLEKTRYGNWVYGTGGNASAARSVGVPVNRVKLMNFMIAGLMAAFAGTMNLGRMDTATPTPTGLELEAIAAAVVGGVSLWGGVGTVVGMLLGTLALSSIEIGLVSSGAPSYWYQAFVGVVIVVVVVINHTLDSVLAKRVRR